MARWAPWSSTSPPGPPWRAGGLPGHGPGHRGARFHTGIHRRQLDGGLAWTAVFPQVAAGRYHLLDPADPDGPPLAQVAVAGGTVHHLDLR